MLLSHAVEKFIKTGKMEYLNEINRIISDSSTDDHDKIFKTIDTTLNNFSDKRNRASLIGMSLGAFLLYGFFLYDTRCNPQFKDSSSTNAIVRGLIETLILFAGATGGFLIAEFTKKPVIFDYVDRANVLKNLIQQHKQNIKPEQSPGLSLASPQVIAQLEALLEGATAEQEQSAADEKTSSPGLR